jgi:hypothetical protein
MLEPWIINEIVHREENRRRGDFPRLEIPLPRPDWPGDGDPGMDHDERGHSVPDRGVIIMGM